MKNHLHLLLALLPAIAFSHAKAQSSNPLFQHIPADADQVYHINVTALGPKVDWQTLASLLKNRNLDKEKSLPFDFATILQDGFDIHRDVIIARSNIYSIDSFTYTTVLAHLSDSGKFASFLISKNFHIRHQPGHDRVATDSLQAIAWTDKIAVMVFAKSPKFLSPATPSEPHLTSKAIAALHGFERSTFTTDTRFTKAFSNDADMQLWNRHAANVSLMDKMLQGSPATAKLGGMMQMITRAGAAPTIGTLRFESGKITFQLIKFVSPQDLSNMKNLSGQGLNSDMLAMIPSGKVLGMGAGHVNVKALLDSISHLIPMDSLNSMLAKKGLKLSDIYNALNGDMVLIAYTPEKAATGANAAKPDIFFLLSVSDPSVFTRLARGIGLSDASTPATTPVTDTAHPGAKMSYTLHNHIVVIGADRGRVGDFFNHPAGAANPADRLLLNPTRPGTVSMGLDMHSVADFLTPMLTKGDTIPAKNQALLDALRQMEVLLMASGVNDDAMAMDLQVRMTDKDRNGLSSLMDILSKLSAKPSGDAAQ